MRQRRHREHPFRSISPHRLYLDKENAKCLGVCAGIADYLGTEPWIIRLFFILLFIPFNVFVLCTYCILGIVLDPKPGDLYETPEKEEFWRGMKESEVRTFASVRTRFRELEDRLRRLEAYVTSKEFNLDQELR